MESLARCQSRVEPRRELSPNQNMLEIGAIPSRCISFRVSSTAFTDMIV